MIDDDGRVTAANQAATSLFGLVVGKRCCDVVRARDQRDDALCTVRCAHRMLRERSGDRDAPSARTRGESHRLVCTTVGDAGVVTLLPSTEHPPVPSPLSPREREVIELVATGLTAAEIARRLGIRTSTVRTHVENARDKLGARTRAEAVARALATRQIS